MALEKITDAGDIVKERKRGRGGEHAVGRGRGKIQVLYARSHAAMAAGTAGKGEMSGSLSLDFRPLAAA